MGLFAGQVGVASKTRLMMRPLLWIGPTPVNNKRKKDLIKFVIGGAIALVLAKAEKLIDKKADDYFPDEDSDQEKN